MQANNHDLLLEGFQNSLRVESAFSSTSPNYSACGGFPFQMGLRKTCCSIFLSITGLILCGWFAGIEI